jgi:hypothetical protein
MGSRGFARASAVAFQATLEAAALCSGLEVVRSHAIPRGANTKGNLMSKVPYLSAYTLLRFGKDQWARRTHIGAFPFPEGGGYMVQLDTIPFDGRFILIPEDQTDCETLMGVYRCLTLPTNSDELSRCSYVNQTHAARRSSTLAASRSFSWLGS